MAWTNNGEVIYRSLFDFQFDLIPSNLNIHSAKLLLFHNPTSLNNNAAHSSLFGPNSTILSKVSEPWEENTVEWNNQPTFSNSNEVYIDESSSENEDFHINITDLLIDILADTASNHGFMLRLEEESPYRCLLFASSDHPDTSLHPRIIIYHSGAARLIENPEGNARIYPNPASNQIQISYMVDGSYTIVNSLGQIVAKGELLKDQSQIIQIDHLPNGVYILESVSKGQKKAQRFIKE